MRKTGDILGRFGRNGRQAGQFHWVHNLAIDSKGNIYTAEVDTGKRVQKFSPKDDDDRRGRDKDDHDRR
jgi:sugar lactone lactonase YvrE